MDYNTQRSKILLPEYGRTVQNMVENVLSLENRAQRQKGAELIIKVMANMFPQSKNVPDFKHKLWDHLALMSDYQLDIDYPYGKPEPKSADSRPMRISYPSHRIGYRHYGKLLESFINYLNELPEGEEKNQLSLLVAGQMKRSLAEWNKDSLNNEKVVADLARYTHGQVQLEAALLKNIGVRSTRPNNNGLRTSRNKRGKRAY